MRRGRGGVIDTRRSWLSARGGGSSGKVFAFGFPGTFIALFLNGFEGC
jgi:hypothetical protein